MATGRAWFRSPRRFWPIVGLSALAFGGFVWWLARPAWLGAEADDAVRATDWRRAAAALDRYLWYRPRDAEAIRGRLEIANYLGDREAALAALAMVPDDSQEAASAHLRRGLILKEMYRAGEAEAAFLKAVARDPGMAEARRQLVALYGIERRAGEQVEQLWGLHESGAAVEALRLLGQSAVVIPPGAISRTADEGAVLAKCLEVDPDARYIRPALARYYRGRGDKVKAIEVIEEALRRGPDDQAARVEWLACRLDEGDDREVAGWFEPPSTPLADLAEYRRLRGDWLGQQGRHGEAVEEYRAAVRLWPRDPVSHYRLAVGLRLAGRSDESERAMSAHGAIQALAETSAAVSAEAPDPSAMLAAAAACRAVGPVRDREAAAWEAEARNRGAGPSGSGSS